MKLRVPLGSGDVAAPRRRLDADRLGHAVGLAEGFDHEVGCQALDALVVNAIDASAGQTGVERCKMRIGNDLDIVEMLVAGGGVAVLQGGGVLGLDVLVQRAPKRPR